MNNDFRKVLDAIEPTEAQKNRMLSGIKKRAAEETVTKPTRKGAKWLRVAAVAAALCCVFGMTVYAEDIGELFTGLFAKDAIVGEMVVTDAYDDADSHVGMTVEEILSDGVTIRMVVRYHALDEQGQQWLEELKYEEFEDDVLKYDLYGFEVTPDLTGNISVYGLNWSCGAREIEEYRTGSERFFVVFMEADRIGWASESYIELSYLMPGGEKKITLDASARVEFDSYEFDPSAAPEKLYIPESANISPLSLVINGTDLGMFERGELNGAKYIKLIAEDKVDRLFLCFKDGSRVNLLNDYAHFTNGTTYTLCSGNGSKGENCCIIASASFKDPIDVSTVSGIELDGVFYPFE